MTIATLEFDHTNWNYGRIILSGNVPRILFIQSSDTMLEINRMLTIAYFENHQNLLTIDIDRISYTFTQPQWEALLSVTDQWLEHYSAAEFSELFNCDNFQQSNLYSFWR